MSGQPASRSRVGLQPQIQPRVLVRARAEVGEGPTISADGQTVHWVDIFAGEVHSTDVATGATTTIRVATTVGAVALRTSGGFVAATGEGFATISLAGTLDTRLPILSSGIRMNDAKCDSVGRFWAGSTAVDFTAGAGGLHVLMPDWTTRQVLDGLTLPNGLGWSPDGTTFYLIDSLRRTLTAFDVDPASGALSGQRLLREFSTDGGLPDGLTVSEDGDLWVALWGGGRILRLSAQGQTRQDLPLPVVQPSSCAFGGPRRDLLLITSACQDLPPVAGALDGCLLSLSGLDARGIATAQFAG